MGARPIDANELQELCNGRIQDKWNSGTAPVSWAAAYADFKDDIDSMPTLTQLNEWVSVADRLPEKKQDVLMYFDTGNMAVGWWHDKDEHITFWCAYTDDGFYTDCDCIPTHWMPLPAPPEVEEDI